MSEKEKIMTNESPEDTRITPDPEPDTVAALAYQLWILRARPEGSPEVDWLRAEEELKNAAMAVR
jgi:hypothetical protein